MPLAIGEIAGLFRYPVKSMAGESLLSTEMGWHGFAGDRRFALRKLGDTGAFPWLTATRFAELITYRPECNEDGAPTHVTTPAGRTLPIFSAELAADIATRSGVPVEMVQYKNGIFDDASISVITTDTIGELARQSGRDLDVRRFRPNILVRLTHPAVFEEDRWLGCVLSFGVEEHAPALAVTMRDVRCAMINLDPDTAQSATEVLKAAVRANHNCAGIYATVTRIGRLQVGQPVFLHAD